MIDGWMRRECSGERVNIETGKDRDLKERQAEQS